MNALNVNSFCKYMYTFIAKFSFSFFPFFLERGGGGGGGGGVGGAVFR